MFKTPNIYRGHANYYQDVIIRPAIFGATAPVQIEFFQCADPMPYAEAIQQRFIRVMTFAHLR
ncbi:MAG TPA: hypothetical protein PKK43_15865, partial [Spirochaetota bacterium]|nr:hypothetical protein [Spirochaetota bacterium]